MTCDTSNACATRIDVNNPCNANAARYDKHMSTAIKLTVMDLATGESRDAKALPLTDELIAVLEARQVLGRAVTDRELINGAREQYGARLSFNRSAPQDEWLSDDAWDAFLTYAAEAGLGVDAAMDDSHLCPAGRRAWETFRDEFESCVERGA